jgi:hypothetical protein
MHAEHADSARLHDLSGLVTVARSSCRERAGLESWKVYENATAPELREADLAVEQ